MTEKQKCNHNAEHKEVLGHVLCVCCTHCQNELSQAKKGKPLDPTLEKLAALEHERWSRWHEHAVKNWTPENIERWNGLAKMRYDELPEFSKDSDRREVLLYYSLLSQAKKDIACLEEISNQHAIDAVNYRKEAEEKDKQIKELEYSLGLNFQKWTSELEDKLSLKDARIRELESVLKEWKMWAEKLADSHEKISLMPCMQNGLAKAQDIAEEVLSDFQKFKESQDPKRCKHDVWASDHCYSCEKESKEK